MQAFDNRFEQAVDAVRSCELKEGAEDLRGAEVGGGVRGGGEGGGDGKSGRGG